MATMARALFPLVVILALAVSGCASDAVELRCDADSVVAGDTITVTAWHAPAMVRSFQDPAFIIQPVGGATGAWTMAEVPRTNSWEGARYEGTFIAQSPGRVRLEAVLGANSSVATCEVSVRPG